MKHTLLLILCTSMAFTLGAKAGDNGSEAPGTTRVDYLQQGDVKGRVVDAYGNPIVGAAAVVVGGTRGVSTGADGSFTLTVDGETLIEISFLGYESRRVNASPGMFLHIELEEDINVLDDVVVVGYGQQRVATVTGSVAQIKTKELTVAPVSNVTHMLAGQLPGLITKQTSGLPGQDDAALQIRGFGTPLIIVDGIESDLNRLDPNQIETISILKDGAASIYGARAGNGVVLITTKRGSANQTTVTLNSSYTLQGSTNVIRPGTSAQRAQYAVDSYLNVETNDPTQVPYTDEEIQKYRDGSDPSYLNTDWFGATVRRMAPQQNHNASVSGGNENVRYFGYFGYNTQQTIIRKNGGHYDRYNFQVNFDAKVTERLSAGMDIQYFREQRYYPSGADMSTSNVNFWRDLIYAANPMYPLELPDPNYLSYAEVTYGNPLFATNSDLAGYRDTRNNVTQFKGEVKYDSKFVDGLYAKGVVILRNNAQDHKEVKKQEQFYTYNADTDEYTFMRSSQDAEKISRSSSNHERLIQQYSLNYDRTFGAGHSLTGMFLYEYQHDKSRGFDASRSNFASMAIEELFAGDPGTADNNSSSAQSGRVSWIGRVNYSYQDRYMIETILRADASSRFAKNDRWGYFPSVSAGWNIVREKFMAGSPFDNLKLRGSYGSSGYDDVANFAYLAGYEFDITYTLGNTLYSGLLPTGLANPYLTWEKMHLYNAGLDFSLWRHKLYGEVEYFYRKRSSIPGSRINSLPSTFGASLPLENLNSLSTSGFELKLGTMGRAGDFGYNITGNIAFTRSKWINYDEATYTDPDEIRLYKNSGRATDRRVGYVFDGLFTSQEEIDNWDCTFADLNNDNSSLRPGDVRYKDLNGDGVIDWRDQTTIGKGANPHWTFGFNFNLNYKNFDLSALFQGAFDYTTYIYWEGSGAIAPFYDNYWHETRYNKANAAIPRPNGSSTNYIYSSYRNHNTAYMRLKNLALGYEIPPAVLDKVGISRLRVYVAGTNLFTLSSLNKYGVDPEMPEGNYGVYYPQQFTISFGVNLTF